MVEGGLFIGNGYIRMSKAGQKVKEVTNLKRQMRMFLPE